VLCVAVLPHLVDTVLHSTLEEKSKQAMSLLEVQDIFKAYGGVHALQGCSISVEQGSITGVIRPQMARAKPRSFM